MRTDRIAVFAISAASFALAHDFADHPVQNSDDAKNKGESGAELVYADGTPIDAEHRPGARTMTVSRLGWECAIRHATTYTATQGAVALAMTRLLGVRVRPRALLVGAAVTLVSHAVIDRRDPLRWVAGKMGKEGYLTNITVVREPGGEADDVGPGTGLMEVDQAFHRLIGLFTAAVVARLS